MQRWMVAASLVLVACGARSELVPGVGGASNAGGGTSGGTPGTGGSGFGGTGGIATGGSGFGGSSFGGTGGVATGGSGVGGTGFGGSGFGGSGVGGSGTGGVVGSGGGGAGGSGAGGTGGSVSAPPGSVGSACTTDSDCPAPLTCWKETSQPGPAHGMCTYNCKGNPNACKTFAPGSFCAYGTGIALCVEDCTPGGTGAFDPNKCHGRSDLGCFYSDDGWGCVPNCNSDADCGAGSYCNPKSGLCQSTPPTGLPTGAACIPNQGDCAGICQDTGSAPLCADRCTLGAVPSCGWNGPGSVAPALCLLATSWPKLDGKTNGTGELAYCLQTCNCDADCSSPDAHCWPIKDPALAAASGKKGVCQGSPPPQALTCN